MTMEIAVVVQVGQRRLALDEPSPLLTPSMADRIFGIDIADQQLAMELTDRLWRTRAVSWPKRCGFGNADGDG